MTALIVRVMGRQTPEGSFVRQLWIVLLSTKR